MRILDFAFLGSRF